VEELRRELNDRLPADVNVLTLNEATPKFHARHDAIGRVYQYQVSTRKTAFAKRQVWWVKPRLDVEAMAAAAECLAGRHDFVQFRQLDPLRPDESTIVVVDSAAIATDGHLVLFRIEASHFLWKMVRRVVGMLVKVGLHEITPEDFRSLVENKPRRKIDVPACTAPASGLFLAEVKYRD
jgi:tRNA pseudouridine38-40 synthase